MIEWPACGSEKVDWVDEAPFGQSRRSLARSRGPYTATIPAFIAERKLVLDGELIAELEDAATALAKFDFEIGAFTTPFASTLLGSESVASSDVEKLTFNAKRLALAELDMNTAGLTNRAPIHKADNATIVVDNINAMRAAIELADELSNDSIIEMHRILLERTQPKVCGAYRVVPVWIGGSYSPHTARFVPPVAQRVPELMNDLIQFLNRPDLPILAQVAIAHAQFETIHPFEDGNGRTGRALVQSLLRHTRLTTNAAVPLSAGLLADTDAYFAALDKYAEGDVLPILRSFSNAAFRAVRNGRILVSQLKQISTNWAAIGGFRSGSAAKIIADLLIEQPVVNLVLLRNLTGLTPKAILNGLARLENIGIVRPINAYKRNRIWGAPDVLKALDEFSDRSRRRNFRAD